MQVLLHYTTNKYVFNYFNKDCCKITDKSQNREIEIFYEKYEKHQENLFLVICYTRLDKQVEYVVGKIQLTEESDFYFNKVDSEITYEVIHELGIEKANTYDKDIYYKENTIEDITGFNCKELTEFSNKFKLKFFCWDELLDRSDILFEKINSILFDQDTVLDMASTYNPNFVSYEERILREKYYSALEGIGFISENEVDTASSVLQGDIGEFLMHFLVSKYINDDPSSTYVYPKLVLKSNPKMPVYGNDGTIYVPEKKVIFYLESKFYTCLNTAVDKAITSLKEHNEITEENIQHKVELFRNIKTKQNFEIVEIDKDIQEKLVLFLICDDIYSKTDIVDCLEKNRNLENLKNNFEILIFVLPILSKKKFLECFKKNSVLKGRQYYEY